MVRTIVLLLVSGLAFGAAAEDKPAEPATKETPEASTDKPAEKPAKEEAPPAEKPILCRYLGWIPTLIGGRMI